MAAEGVRVEVDRSPVTCPRCREPLEAAALDWVACSACLARHHSSCWSSRGRCETCGGAVALEPRAGEQAPRVLPRPAATGKSEPAPSFVNRLVNQPRKALAAIALIALALVLVQVRRTRPVIDPDEPEMPPHAASEPAPKPLEAVDPVELRRVVGEGPVKLVRAWRWRRESSWAGAGHSVGPAGRATAERPTGLKAFDLATGEITQDLPEERNVERVAWAADGRRALAVGPDGLRLWDLARGTARALDARSSGPIAFAPDGARVLVARAGGEVARVDLASGKRERAFPQDGVEVTALALPRAGLELAGSASGRIRVRWPEGTLAIDHEGRVFAIAASTDCKRVHVVSGNAIEAIDLEQLAGVWWTRAPVSGNVVGASFSPDGRLALAFVPEGAWLLDTANGRQLKWLALGTPRDAAWSQDSRTVVIATDRFFAVELDVAVPEPSPVEALEAGARRALEASPGGVRVALEPVVRSWTRADPWASGEWRSGVETLRRNRGPAALALLHQMEAIAPRSSARDAKAQVRHALALISGGSGETSLEKMTTEARDAHARALCAELGPALANPSLEPRDLSKLFRDVLGPAKLAPSRERVLDAELDPSLVPILLGPFAESPELRWPAARLLAMLARLDRAPGLEEALAEPERPAFSRLVAAVALWESGRHACPFDSLAPLLENESALRARPALAIALGRAGSDDVVPALVRVAAHEQWLTAREAATKVLNRDFAHAKVALAVRDELAKLPRSDRRGALRLLTVALDAGLARPDELVSKKALRSLVGSFLERRLEDADAEEEAPVVKSALELFTSLTGETWIDSTDPTPTYLLGRAEAFVKAWKDLH